MKKTKIYLILLSIIIINSISYAEWQKDGNLEWLKISNSAIKQYVFSQDGKSVYVLDTSNVFFKYDIERGSQIWMKELGTLQYEDYTFEGACISEDADYYLVWFVKGATNYRFQLRNIEKDNILTSFTLQRSYQKKNYNFFTSSEFIILYEWFSEYFGVPYGYVHETTGKIKNIRRYNDTINSFRQIDSTYLQGWDFKSKLNIFLGSSYYLYSAVYYYHEGGTRSDYTYYQQTFIHYLQNDSLRILNDTLYTSIMLSNDGNYMAGQYNKELINYELEKFKKISKIPYPDSIYCKVYSNDGKFLLLSYKNSIRVHNYTKLEPIDTLNFTNLTSNIENLQCSQDNNYFYFSSGNNIYRTTYDKQKSYLSAFFYPDTTIIEVNKPIQFYDASTKNAKTFLWDFGDGTTSTEQNPTHQYADTGFFDVKLIASDGTNQDTFLIKNCVYILPELRADFDFKIYESELPVKVEFINKSIGKIDSVEWDFGDYTTSKEFSPTHYYRYNDTMIIKLRIHSMQIVSEVIKQIIVNTTQSLINQSEWKYETIYRDIANISAINGIELKGEKIVFIHDKDNTPIEINNAGDLLWHKIWDSTSGFKDKVTRYLLQRYPANNNYFLYGEDSLLSIINSNGNIITKYNFFQQLIDTIQYYKNLDFGNISFNGNNIVLGVGFSYGSQGSYSSPIYSLNMLEFEPDLKLLNNIKLTSYVVDASPYGYNLSSVCNVINKGNNIDYLIRQRVMANVINSDGLIRSSDAWETVSLNLNDSIIYYYHNYIDNVNHYLNAPFKGKYYYLFNSFIRLNDNTLIVAFQDTTVKFFNNQNKITKNLRYDGMYFKSLITLDSANFLAAGSINDSPGYAIINDAGEVVKTVILPGRYGGVNSIAITPDTNLLFSGYQFIDKELHRRPYFAKTNSEDIREWISQYMPTDTSIIDPGDTTKIPKIQTIYPNPTNNEIRIGGIDNYDGWSYTIVNLLGREIRKEVLKSNTISIAELPKGMYFITLEYQGKIIPLKFIKD